MDPLTNLTTKRAATAASWEKLNLSAVLEAVQCLKYDDDIVDGANSGGIHLQVIGESSLTLTGPGGWG